MILTFLVNIRVTAGTISIKLEALIGNYQFLLQPLTNRRFTMYETTLTF